MILTTAIYAIDIITLLILVGAYMGGMHADKEGKADD
jgi:hypothetical protein